MKDISKKTVLMDMKSIFISIFCALTVPLMATNELDIELNKFYKANNIVVENKSVDDYTLIRRLYIDIAGRIPNTEEIKAFITAKFPNKKQLMVEKLIYSEDYVNNFYNFWADILRIRPDRLGDGIQMKSYPYMEYVRDFIRSDKPYNQFVTELLTATGKITDNPASSYLIRDDGMALDNLAITGQIFIGTNIACAQCHDDPFQDYSQKQFYELAAFFNNNNRENRKDYASILKKVDEEIKQINKTDRIDNSVRQLLGSNLFNVQDDPNKSTRLPHDFKYLNEGKPNEVVQPVSLDGLVKNVANNKRVEFAKWLVSHQNFGPSIINRIWEDIVGANLFFPEATTNFTIGNSKNKDIVLFLDSYFKKHNYSIKSIVSLIVNSDFYSKRAYNGKLIDYNNQGITIKRISPYKMWDSVLSLILDDVNYSKVSFSKYSDVFEINWDGVSGASLLKQVQDIRDYEKSLNDSFLKYKGIDLARSCFLLNRNNGFVGTFLKEFGASDRILIDSGDNQGSITQILTLMNSQLIDIICEDKSQLMQAFKKNPNGKEIVFTAIMGRPAGIFEKDLVNGTNINDLIWSLLNTKEFMFRK